MMTFEHFPKDTICPLCGGSDDRECTLVEVCNSNRGTIVAALPTHADCVRRLFGEFADRAAYTDDYGVVIVCMRKKSGA